MITGLSTRLDGAFFFALEELYQFSNSGFFDAEAFLAGMIGCGIEVSDPGRMSGRHKLRRLS